MALVPTVEVLAFNSLGVRGELEMTDVGDVGEAWGVTAAR
ncbi:unannotated protein [freshwater metagenome]|uniref:Unannotated protein n=1 Tax=freshwater metagenome TaxID=449393 RepID=A0A6J7LRN4_9ZZZZ